MSKNKKAAKKNEPPSSIDRNRFNMKIVASDTCQACKQRCTRGIRYLERMSEPGAIGTGVPCPLTRGKSFK